jgi:carboxypeptidase Taq
MSRQYAGFFPQGAHVMDSLIDMHDSGMNVATLRPLFKSLREGLIPMVDAISKKQQIDDSCLAGPFPIDQQLTYARTIAEQVGYDFNRGRLDTAPHPFEIRLHHGDIRITTRARENDLGDCIFSVIHECGHAMYEQGVAFELEGTPLANGTSSGVHESQSRLWENQIGRSRTFWQHNYPSLQAAFPAQLKDVSLETFYRAITARKRHHGFPAPIAGSRRYSRAAVLAWINRSGTPAPAAATTLENDVAACEATLLRRASSLVGVEEGRRT